MVASPSADGGVNRGVVAAQDALGDEYPRASAAG
jgi:hypothetical protein